MKAMAALAPPNKCSQSSGLVASPQRTRCSPSRNRSPSWALGFSYAVRRAASRSKISGRSRFSRASRPLSSCLISFSSKPERVRSKLWGFGEVGEQPGQQLLVEVAGDLVEGHVQELGPLLGDVEEDDRHGLQPELPGGEQSLMTADHRLVFLPCDDRVDQSELLDAPRQGFKLSLRDMAGVGGIGLEVVDGHVGDGQGEDGVFIGDTSLSVKSRQRAVRAEGNAAELRGRRTGVVAASWRQRKPYGNLTKPGVGWTDIRTRRPWARVPSTTVCLWPIPSWAKRPGAEPGRFLSS